LPSLSAVTERVVPFALFVAVITAPGTAAPFGSSTLPRNSAVAVACAKIEVIFIKTKHKHNEKNIKNFFIKTISFTADFLLSYF
jgi:hypothetical protein